MPGKINLYNCHCFKHYLMPAKSTKNAFLCIESVDESRNQNLLQALDQLTDLIGNNLGGTTEIKVLNNENKEIDI